MNQTSESVLNYVGVHTHCILLICTNKKVPDSLGDVKTILLSKALDLKSLKLT